MTLLRGVGARVSIGRPTLSCQRRYLALLVFASIFACLHVFMSGAGRLILPGSAGEGRRGTSDARPPYDSGGVALWPPPPSSHQEAPALQPLQEPAHPLVPDHAHQTQKATHVTSSDVRARGHHPTTNNSRDYAPFPWPVRQNFVPNLFLNHGKNSTSGAGRNSAGYGAGDLLVYLHHNKAAGTTTKKCLTTLFGAGVGRSAGPVMSSQNRLALETRFDRNPLFMLRSRPNTYFGGYAFGLCDRFQNRSCAYFTVLRDPYERSLSSHNYCKRARSDQLCTAQAPGRVSLRDWALHQGSFFFRQLLYSPEFCSDRSRWMDQVRLDDVPHDFLTKRKEPWKGAPCWFRQKLIMELTLDSREREALLRYCLDNMERWFAVIMMVDHYDESLLMAQEVLKIPLHTLCAGKHANQGSYHDTDNLAANSKLTNGTKDAGDSKKARDSVHAQLLALRQDPEVREALRADQLLYEKGLEIFNKQRQVFHSMRTPK